MKTKKEKFAYGFILHLFMFVQLVCRTLEVNGNMNWNVKNISMFLGISALFTVFVVGTIYATQIVIKKWFNKELNNVKDIKKNDNSKSGRLFFVSWFIIFLCWLPLFLAYYPGILAYDSGNQIGQIVNSSYNNHHPLIHTLIIAAFLKLGELIGSMNVGIAIYTIIQMLCLSATMAIGIYLLGNRGVKRIWLGLLILYCGLCPVNSYMAVSMTKDVFFTVFVFLFVFTLLYLLGDEKHSRVWDVVYVCVTSIMMLFRNNGKYAMLVFLGLGFIMLFIEYMINRKKEDGVNKKEITKKRKRILYLLCETVISLILSVFVLSGLDSMVASQEGDKREMLSIPIQQISRCMVYHGGLDIINGDDNTISEADKNLINEFILYDGYLKYDPFISDPVKICTNTSVVLNKMRDFISMYIRFAFDYPEEYINAFMEVNGGYLSVLDKTHSEVNLKEEIMGLGYLQTHWVEEVFKEIGIYKESKWPELYVVFEKFAGENGYLELPIVRQLVAPGMYLWCYILLGVWMAFRKEIIYQLPMFFISCYYATLLLGPTVQLRYLYPVMLLLPFFYLYISSCKRSSTSLMNSN